MQKEGATCPECRSVPGPKEIYSHKEIDDEEEEEEDQEETSTTIMTPLASLFQSQSDAAMTWIENLPRSEIWTAKFVNPAFMPSFNALLPTIDIEERIAFGSSNMITPLCFASSLEGCEEAVACLIQSGANLKSLGVFCNCNCCAIGEETMENALFGACMVVSSECVKAILATGVDPNIVDVDGNTPLMRCLDVSRINNWRLDIIKFLLESGAKVSLRDLSGKNVFHKMFGQWERVKLSKDGFTPMQVHDLLMEAYVTEIKN